jgi:F0F1-type ATP synthase membrane subunit b/b'
MDILNSHIIVSLWHGLNTPLTQFNIIPLNVLEQAVIFWIIWFLLNQVFFKPFSRVYEKRSSKTVKAIEEAKLLNKESGDLEAELKNKIDEAIVAASSLRLSVTEEAKKNREDTLKKANEAMQEQLKSIMEKIEKEKVEILNRLSSDIQQFIPLISRKMMLK